MQGASRRRPNTQQPSGLGSLWAHTAVASRLLCMTQPRVLRLGLHPNRLQRLPNLFINESLACLQGFQRSQAGLDIGRLYRNLQAAHATQFVQSRINCAVAGIEISGQHGFSGIKIGVKT